MPDPAARPGMPSSAPCLANCDRLAAGGFHFALHDSIDRAGRPLRRAKQRLRASGTVPALPPATLSSNLQTGNCNMKAIRSGIPALQRVNRAIAVPGRRRPGQLAGLAHRHDSGSALLPRHTFPGRGLAASFPGSGNSSRRPDGSQVYGPPGSLPTRGRKIHGRKPN